MSTLSSLVPALVFVALAYVLYTVKTSDPAPHEHVPLHAIGTSLVKTVRPDAHKVGKKRIDLLVI